MRIFVTGATGVLGSRAVPHMLEAGHEVTAVGRNPEKRALLERQGARAVDVDLFDPEAVRRAVRGAEVICNLATAVPPTEIGTVLPWSWREMDRIRRHVSAHLVDAALAEDTGQRVVQESFAPIYADGGDAWLDESSTVRPARYNRTALDAEASADRPRRCGAPVRDAVRPRGWHDRDPDRGSPAGVVRALRAAGGLLLVGRARGRRAGGGCRPRRAGRRLQRGGGRADAAAGAGERDRAAAGRAPAPVATPLGHAHRLRRRGDDRAVAAGVQSEASERERLDAAVSHGARWVRGDHYEGATPTRPFAPLRMTRGAAFRLVDSPVSFRLAKGRRQTPSRHPRAVRLAAPAMSAPAHLDTALSA